MRSVLGRVVEPEPRNADEADRGVEETDFAEVVDGVDEEGLEADDAVEPPARLAAAPELVRVDAVDLVEVDEVFLVVERDSTRGTSFKTFPRLFFDLTTIRADTQLSAPNRRARR